MRYRVALAFLLLAGNAAAEQREAELIRLPAPVGLARLVKPETASTAPLVIILPDAFGEDGRAAPYIDALLGRGIAALELGLKDTTKRSGPALEPTATPVAVLPAVAWAQAAGYSASSIGLMGFGLGGRAALAGTEGQPVVALYPGCTALRVPDSSDALILQGGEADDDCAHLQLPPAVSLHILPGVGRGWDAPGAVRAELDLLRGAPSDRPGEMARTTASATLWAADTLAAWFAALLLPSTRAATQ